MQHRIHEGYSLMHANAAVHLRCCTPAVVSSSWSAATSPPRDSTCPLTSTRTPGTPGNRSAGVRLIKRMLSVTLSLSSWPAAGEGDGRGICVSSRRCVAKRQHLQAAPHMLPAKPTGNSAKEGEHAKQHGAHQAGKAWALALRQSHCQQRPCPEQCGWAAAGQCCWRSQGRKGAWSCRQMT